MKQCRQSLIPTRCCPSPSTRSGRSSAGVAHGRTRAGWTRARLSSAIDQLLAAGRIELDETGMVGAHGVTLRSTAHRIRHDGLETSTWCAFDAVGIPAALGVEPRSVSSCPACRRQLKVVIAAGVPADDPLVWMPIGPCRTSSGLLSGHEPLLLARARRRLAQKVRDARWRRAALRGDRRTRPAGLGRRRRACPDTRIGNDRARCGVTGVTGTGETT